MASQALNRLSVAEAARLIARGEATSEAVVRACLDRIAEREPAVHAWAFLDPDLALRQARACDQAARKGPLHGVPIAVKDIIETADMPTGMGSPIYDGYRPLADASCVAVLRAAGAVILGKTVTAEFAGVAPGATTHPFDPARTPGGSSSGSAAAVADFMVPAAFGTQTGGSTLRPASYCGVVGYKPTFGMINPAGVKPAAESLDTVGLIARDLDDVELLLDLFVGRLPEKPAIVEKPRIGFVRTPMWSNAQPETVAAVEDAAARLDKAGSPVRDITLSSDAALLSEQRGIINDFERARGMAYEWANHRPRISERLSKTIAHGFTIPYETYAGTLQLAQHCRAELDDIFRDVDVLLAPCVNGEAPVGLDSTGDPVFQSLWTMLHVPTVSLPTHTAPSGLPVGIQLVGPAFGDKTLLHAARWIFGQLGPWQRPAQAL